MVICFVIAQKLQRAHAHLGRQFVGGVRKNDEVCVNADRLEGLLECFGAFDARFAAVLIERARDIAGLIILRSNANPERDFFQRLPVDRLADTFLQIADAIWKWNDLGALVSRLFLGRQGVRACRERDNALDAVGIKVGEAMR